MLLAIGLWGCAADAPAVRHAPDEGVPDPPSDPATTAPEPPTESDPPDVDTGGPCPTGMVGIDDTFCIDRWEAAIADWSPFEIPDGQHPAIAEGGIQPQGYISGELGEAACALAGKRLCTLDEWMRTCEGPDRTVYPYGDIYDPNACNDTRPEHPLISLFGSDVDWSSAQMNDPRINQQPDTVANGGAFTGCVSAESVFDLHGNLHEWVSDPDGTFKGGFYMDAVINGPGCTYTTGAHSFDYHDYSTGFRCCSDL
jgi:hypothetical protein